MATDNRVHFPVSLPENLADQVEQMARTENLSTDALVEEALKHELLKRRHAALQKVGQKHSADNGFTEVDVPRLIAESRAERGR